MMELLVSHGADVNAAWHGLYPVVFATCETLDPIALDWLLQHGADPDCGEVSEWQSKGRAHPGTALDFVLGTYVRDKDALVQSINLIRADGSSQYDEPGVIATISGDSKEIDMLLGKDPSVIERRYPSLNIGTTAGRTDAQRRDAVARSRGVRPSWDREAITRSGSKYRCTCCY